MYCRHLVVALACLLALTTLLTAQPPSEGNNEPLVDQVRKAIEWGATYLKDQQKGDGSWAEYDEKDHPGGTTALALLALLNAGVPRDDAVIKNGLNHLRKYKDSSTYVRSLQTMAYVEAGYAQDVERIKYNVNQLLVNAIYDKAGNLEGWRYDYGGNHAIGGRPDNSNTQCALLALWAAEQSGIDINPKLKLWEKVRDFYAGTQVKKDTDWGWLYANDGDASAFGKGGQTLTMTTAAVCGLLMAQMAMNARNDKQDPVENCGKYQDDVALRKGLHFIAKKFQLNLQGRNYYTYYNLYGLERLGRLSGMRFFGQYDWYREGCAWLVKNQHLLEGSWDGPSKWEKVVNTSFALLFLSKGRTPVLISKLAHGDLPRQTNDQDWTRRRNDLRHLVDFASKKVFQKMPLAWQNFDMMRAALTTESQMNQVAADLLQSPIVYITGHDDPNLRLKSVEKGILKTYVENGGFILAVACCGKTEFDKGFRDLCKELFPDKDLQLLDPDHAVWDIGFKSLHGSFKLEGLQLGCKTVVIYCPENLCGYWELNRKDDKGDGEKAFQLGANIIAYATGLEAPKPRLTEIKLAFKAKVEKQENLRGYFRIAQLVGSKANPQKAMWTPAREAMTQLAQHLRERVGLDIILKTDLVSIDDESVKSYKFLYMHGRHDFKFRSKELELLRLNLQNGGLLLADACCGKPEFDKGFRQFIADLFPREAFPGLNANNLPRLEPIPFDDDLFGAKLNDAKLDKANIQLRQERGKEPNPSLPLLEGVKIHNRWVVIYSKYDIGCALERHQSADCAGYSYDSALRLARAAVLYQFALLDRKQ
jgi:hypothetical protein